MTRPDERVVVGVHVDDDATRPLRRIERQAGQTGRELRRMDDSTGGLDKRLKRLERSGDKAVGSLMKMLKLPAVATAVNVLAASVGALGAAGAAGVAGLSPLIGVVGALPGLALSVVGAVGVVKLATNGLSDAIKTVTDPKATVQQYQEAMKNLTPEARRFVGELALMKKETKGLQQEAQRGLLPGLQDGLKSLRGLLPTVRVMVRQNATELGSLARQGAAAMASGPWRRDFATIGTRNARLLGTMGAAGGSLATALRDIVITAGPMLQMLADGVRHWAAWVQQTTAAGRSSGRLERFFLRSGRLLKDTLHVVGDFGAGLFNVFREGTSLGNDMGASIADVGKRFRAWSGSDAGRERVRKFFADSKPVVYAFAHLIGSVSSALGRLGSDPTLAPLIDRIADELVPALSAMVGSVGGSGGLGNAAVTLAVSWANLMSVLRAGAVVDVANAIASVIGKVTDLVGKVPAIGTVVGAIIAFRIAVLALNIALSRTVTLLAIGPLLRFTRAASGATVATTGLATRLGLVANRFIQLRAMSSTTQALKFMLRSGVAPLTAGLTAMAGAVGLSLGPFLLVIAAVAATVAAIVLLWRNWDQVMGWIKTHKALAVVISILTGGVAPAIVGITWALRELHEHWGDIWDAISNAPGMHWTKVGLGWIADKIKWVIDNIGRISLTDKSLKHAGGKLLGWANPFGDTPRPRAGAGVGLRGNVGRAMSVHAALRGPGQKVTSGYRTHSLGSPGSDHGTGKAWDVTGPGLGAYARGVQARGGFAEMHGSGEGRHLHAAIGDTSRPRATSSSGGDVINFHPGSIVVMEPQSAFDVEQAVAAGIELYMQQRRERGGDPS